MVPLRRIPGFRVPLGMTGKEALPEVRRPPGGPGRAVPGVPAGLPGQALRRGLPLPLVPGFWSRLPADAAAPQAAGWCVCLARTSGLALPPAVPRSLGSRNPDGQGQRGRRPSRGCPVLPPARPPGRVSEGEGAGPQSAGPVRTAIALPGRPQQAAGRWVAPPRAGTVPGPYRITSRSVAAMGSPAVGCRGCPGKALLEALEGRIPSGRPGPNHEQVG